MFWGIYNRRKQINGDIILGDKNIQAMGKGRNNVEEIFRNKCIYLGNKSVRIQVIDATNVGK